MPAARIPGVGLQLLGERYYDPVVGRFISPDPIRFDGGLNLYQYCGNDPVNCLDPDGEFVGALVALSVAVRIADVVALIYDSTELVRDLSMCGTPGWKTTLDGLAVGFDLLSFDAGVPSVTGVGVRWAEAAIVRAAARELAREAAERAAFRAGVYAAKRAGSSGLGKTQHFDLRTAEGRRTGQVVNDMQRAGRSHVFIDEETGNFVVRGPNGREHIISPEGRGVTGIDRSRAAHRGRLDSGRIREASEEEFRQLKGLIP